MRQKELVTVPALNHAWRQLKFRAEGLSPYERVRSRKVAKLADVIRREVGAQVFASRTELSGKHRKLYELVCKSPYSSLAFRVAGIVGGRPDYWYWSDEQLICAAAPVGSFMKLQHRSNLLRCHIAGRQLYDALVCANPAYAKHSRVGLGGLRYRSEPELVIGNLLFFNKVECEREAPVNQHGRRPRIADFRFDERHLLEIVQNVIGDRGARRAAYVRRSKQKRKAYERHGWSFLFVDSDHFYSNGVFRAVEFAEHVRDRVLKAFSIDIGPVPPGADLLFEDNTDKRVLLSGTRNEVEQYLAAHSIVGIAALQNRHSWVLTCLRHRNDGDGIIKRLKRESIMRGITKRVATRLRNQGEWAPIAAARDLCRKLDIKTQTQFFAEAKRKAEEFKTYRVPRNPYLVYRRLGTWKSWRDLLATQ